MNAQKIRCQYDLELYRKLVENRDVKRVNELILKHEGSNSPKVRRKLLASSVRLSRAMAPQIHEMADHCIKRLGADIPLELYVFASSDFNAMCFKPEDGRLFIMFSSSLLEGFNDSELMFVMGHELGHYIYGHHDIPIGYLLQGKVKPDPGLVLELFAWSRYAEISADRAGAFCANDLTGVARSLFKLASGLTGKTIRFNLNDFLKQIDDMQLDNELQRGPKEDWFSTHPFSPLRVKALKLFDESEYSVDDGMAKDDLEIAVQGLMSLMEPSYIEGKTVTATTMRRLLYTGSIAVANASGGIEEKEVKLFESFFGEGEFTRGFDIDRLIADLPNRIENVKKNASHLQRMQVLRDLCLMAQASGEVTSKELKMLLDIARDLDIGEGYIHQTLKESRALD